MIKTENNGVCTFCGCLCDDISVDVEDGKIIKTRGLCGNGRAMFENYHSDFMLPTIDGKEASWDEAIGAAAEIFKAARSPFFYGFSSSSSEAQRLAVQLGDIIGATMDTTSSVCHGPTGLAMQAVGESSCTLGEVKNRADLIVFWGCNPATAHPRHLVRYSLMPKGRYIEGRKGRRMIVADVRPTGTTKAADLFLQLAQGMDYEVLHALRLILKGVKVSEPVGGVSPELLVQTVNEMKNCKYGVAFMGMGITMSRGRDMNVRELFALVTDLNAHTRFSVIPMRGHGNVTGADQVFTWQTGFPFAVNLARGYPRYGPGEYTAVDMFAKRETDAALILSSDPGAHFPKKAVDYMKEIPLVVMDPEKSLSAEIAKVWLPVAKYGIDSPGTAYRMDTVPLLARALIPAHRPSDEEVLTKIIKEIRS